MKKILLLFLFISFEQILCQEYLQKIQAIDKKIEDAKQLSLNNPKKSIAILKETYSLSKQLSYSKGLLETNKALMSQYYDIGNFKEVLVISKETEKIANENNDVAALSNIYRLKAIAYTELGFNDNCLIELKKALKTSLSIRSEDQKNYCQSLIYNGFAVYMAHINAPVDSVIYYQKKNLEHTLKITSSTDYQNKKYQNIALVYMNLGMTSVAKKNIKAAEKYLTKALNTCENKKYHINIRTYILILNEFAWLNYDQKKYDKAIEYALRAEKFERQISFPYIRRDLFEVLLKSYVEKGEKEKSSEYMKAFSSLNDSIVNSEKKTINTPVKQLLSEQNTHNNNNIQNILIVVFLALISLALMSLFFWKRNQKKLHLKYEAIISNLKIQEKVSTPEHTSAADKSSNEKNFSINITDNTTNSILIKLNKFEKSQKFIKKDLSMTSLANELNTNTRYLSEIIKQHKGKNYNNYINDLRIRYIINKLYENPVYREYKISYLAETSGFSSREVFAVIFKKETGVTPSYFINNLKKDHQEQKSM